MSDFRQYLGDLRITSGESRTPPSHLPAAPSFFPSEASFPLSLPLHPLSVSLPPLYLRLSPSVLSVPLSLAEHAARVNAPSLTSARAVDQPIYSAYLPTHLPTYRHLFTVAQGARPAPRIGGIAGCTRATCFRTRAPPSRTGRVARSMMRLDFPGPERFYGPTIIRASLSEAPAVYSGQ